MRLSPLLLLLSAACAARHAPTDTPPGDTPTDSSGPDSPGTDSPGEDQELYGTPPSEPRPAPEFEALNRDGTPRGRDDLLGHPTVLWFFPAAGTYG